MATFEFTKMHGCGNDYIYVIATQTRPRDPASFSRRISDRHFGIGGDGLIMLCPSTVADLRMEMYNADGSRAEMCGNGIRCLARLAYERGLARRDPLRVETDCGIKNIKLHFEGEIPVAATVDMGAPSLEGSEIPTLATGKLINYPLDVEGRTELITAVSMDNPHCVVLVTDERVFQLSDRDFADLGRRFERHPFFPRGVNTEFVLPLSNERMKMRVWERGSGETMACGTGACASLVAAILNGKSARKAQVELRGGILEIEWRESGPERDHVFMKGEAIEVFRGTMEIDPKDLIKVS
jgi:diaminopimelate epimerase